MDTEEISLIEKNLYLGNIDGACNKTLLKKHQITHIINLSNEENSFPNDFEYLKIDMLDTYQAFILPHFPKVIDFIQKALLNENVIFVHCMAGISRSSTAILSYIMKIQNMSTWDSIRYLQTKRKMIQPNKSFVFQLQNWYKMGFKLEGESKMHLKYNLMRLENQAFKIIKKLDVWGEEETLYSSLITVVEVLSKEKFFFNQGSFQVLKNLSEQKNDYVYNLFCDCIELRYYPLIINHSWESDPFYTHFIKPLNIYLTKIQNLSLN